MEWFKTKVFSWSSGGQKSEIKAAAGPWSPCKWQLLSHVQFSVILSTVAHQAPLSMAFFRQEYWSGLPFPSLEDLPDPGIEPSLLHYRQCLYHLSREASGEGPFLAFPGFWWLPACVGSWQHRSHLCIHFQAVLSLVSVFMLSYLIFFSMGFIHLFLPAWVLCCCAWAFSSCGAGATLQLRRAGFSPVWLLLCSWGSRALAE